MEIEYIEDLIDRENIKLIDTYLNDSAGAYANYKQLKIIMYDNSKLDSSLAKKETLLEELGHYYYDATYKFTSSAELVSKQEYRAKKFSYNLLVPYEKLKSAIEKRN